MLHEDPRMHNQKLTKVLQMSKQKNPQDKQGYGHCSSLS